MDIKEVSKNYFLLDRTLLIPGESISILIEPGYDMIISGKFAGSSIEKALNLVEQWNKPLQYIGITHSHGDHIGNLPFYFKRLKQNVQVIVSSESPLVKPPKETIMGVPQMPFFPQAQYQPISQDCILCLDGIECQIYCTPGHSYLLEDISFFFPQNGILYLGDLLQPQGRSYEYSDGVSPVPLFWNGIEYLATLEKLMKIPFQMIITGHGDIYSKEEGLNAIQVTYTSIQKMQFWSAQFYNENPQECLETICIQAYDQIVKERHFDINRANQRKTVVNKEFNKTDYECFDRPGLRYFVEHAKNSLL